MSSEEKMERGHGEVMKYEEESGKVSQLCSFKCLLAVEGTISSVRKRKW